MFNLGPDTPLWLILILVGAYLLVRLIAALPKWFREIMPSDSNGRENVLCRLLEHRRAMVADRRRDRKERRQERHERRQARRAERKNRRKPPEIEDETGD